MSRVAGTQYLDELVCLWVQKGYHMFVAHGERSEPAAAAIGKAGRMPAAGRLRGPQDASTRRATRGANYNTIGLTDKAGNEVERYACTPHAQAVMDQPSGRGDFDDHRRLATACKETRACAWLLPLRCCRSSHEQQIIRGLMNNAMASLRAGPASRRQAKHTYILAYVLGCMVMVSAQARAAFCPGMPATIPLADWPDMAAAGDFDGDGHPDLAVAVINSGDVAIFKNDGSGHLGPPARYFVELGVSAIAVGDLDRDGDQDILAGDGFGGLNLWLLLNRGDGTFEPAIPVGPVRSPRAIVVCELNGDGWPDVVVSNFLGNDVTVFLGGAPAPVFFANTTNYAPCAAPWGLDCCDVDGDGDLDFAVECGYGPDYWVHVFFNKGDGTFPMVNVFPMGWNGTPFELICRDLNGDKYPDVAANLFASAANAIEVRLNDGSAGFNGYARYSAGEGPVSLEAHDLDGDGDLDLIAANFWSDDVSVLLNDGTGAFPEEVRVLAGWSPFEATASDLDGDGDLDLVVVNRRGNSVYVYMNGLSASRGNFDGDCDIDIADFLVFQQCFGGSNRPPAPTCPPGVDADLDNDGDVDLNDFIIFQYNFTGSM